MTVDLSDIVGPILLLLIGWVIKLLYRLFDEIAATRGKIAAIETWGTGHDRLDTERFEALQREIHQLREAS